MNRLPCGYGRRALALVFGIASLIGATPERAHAQAVQNDDDGFFDDPYGTSADLVGFSTSGLRLVGGAFTLKADVASADIVTTPITPASHSAWGRVYFRWSGSDPSGITLAAVRSDNTIVPLTWGPNPDTATLPGFNAMAVLPPSLGVDKPIRIRFLLSRTSPVDPHIDHLRVTWTPYSKLNLSYSAATTVCSGATASHALNTSVSFVRADNLLLTLSLPEANTPAPPGLTPAEEAAFRASTRAVFVNAQAPSGATTGATAGSALTLAPGVVVPPHTAYAWFPTARPGQTFNVQFNTRAPLGMVGTRAGVANVTYPFEAKASATNADLVQRAASTLVNSTPNLVVRKLPLAGTYPLFNQIWANAGTHVDFALSVTNQFAPTCAADAYNLVLSDDLLGVVADGGAAPPFVTSDDHVVVTNLDGLTYQTSSQTHFAPTSTYANPVTVGSGQVVATIPKLEVGHSRTFRFRVQLKGGGAFRTPLPHDFFTNVARLRSAFTMQPADQSAPLRIEIDPPYTPSGIFAKGDRVGPSSQISALMNDNAATTVPPGASFGFLLHARNTGLSKLVSPMFFDRVPAGTVLSWLTSSAPGTRFFVRTLDDGVPDAAAPGGFRPPGFDPAPWAPPADIASTLDASWTELSASTNLAAVKWVAVIAPTLDSPFDTGTTLLTSVTAELGVTVPSDVGCEGATIVNHGQFYLMAHTDRDGAVVDMNTTLAQGFIDSEPMGVRPIVPRVEESVASISEGTLFTPGPLTFNVSLRNVGSGFTPVGDLLAAVALINLPTINVDGVPRTLSVSSIDTAGGTLVQDGSGGVVEIRWPVRNAGSHTNVSVTVNVPRGLLDPTTIPFSAVVRGDGEVCGSVSKALGAAGNAAYKPHLQVVKDVDYTVAGRGSPLTYTLLYRNIGVAPSTGTFLLEKLPSALDFVSVELDQPTDQVLFSSAELLAGVGDYENPLSAFLTAGAFQPGIPGSGTTWTSPFGAATRWIVVLVDRPYLGPIPPQFPTSTAAAPGRLVIHSTIADDVVRAPQGLAIYNRSGIGSSALLPAVSNSVRTVIAEPPSLGIVERECAPRVVAGGEEFVVSTTYRNKSTNPASAFSIVEFIPEAPAGGTLNVLTVSYVRPSGATGSFPFSAFATSAQPAGFSLVSDGGASKVVWDVGGLLPNEQATLALRMTVTDVATGQAFFSEGGAFASREVDSVQLSDEIGTTCAFLVANPDLAVAKTVDVNDPVSGDIVTFTVRLANLNPHFQSGVALVDTLPNHLAYVPGSARIQTPGWTIQGQGHPNAAPHLAPASTPSAWNPTDPQQVLTWSVATSTALVNAPNAAGYVPGDSGDIVITFKARVKDGVPPDTAFLNHVAVTGTLDDDDPSNNEDDAPLKTPLPDLVVQKTGPASAFAGDIINYELGYRNSSRQFASGVVLFDRLPRELGPAGLPDPTDTLPDVVVQAVTPAPGDAVWFSDAAFGPVEGLSFDLANPAGSGWSSTPLPVTRWIAIVPNGANPSTAGHVPASSPVRTATVTVRLADPTGVLGAPSAEYDNCLLSRYQGGTLEASDRTSSDNQSCVTTALPGFDLSLTKRCGVPCANDGEPSSGSEPCVDISTYPRPNDVVLFELTIRSAGRDPVRGIRVTDLLPPQFTLQAVSPVAEVRDRFGALTGAIDPTGTLIAEPVAWTALSDGSTWVLGDAETTSARYFHNVGLAGGSSAKLYLTAVVNPDVPGRTTVTNSATVAAEVFTDPESFLANNTGLCELTIMRPDLLVTKDGPTLAVGYGSAVTWTIGFNNVGQAPAEQVTMIETLPDGVVLDPDLFEVPVGWEVDYFTAEGDLWDPQDGPAAIRSVLFTWLGTDTAPGRMDAPAAGGAYREDATFPGAVANGAFADSGIVFAGNGSGPGLPSYTMPVQPPAPGVLGWGRFVLNRPATCPNPEDCPTGNPNGPLLVTLRDQNGTPILPFVQVLAADGSLSLDLSGVDPSVVTQMTATIEFPASGTGVNPAAYQTLSGARQLNGEVWFTVAEDNLVGLLYQPQTGCGFSTKALPVRWLKEGGQWVPHFYALPDELDSDFWRVTEILGAGDGWIVVQFREQYGDSRIAMAQAWSYDLVPYGDAYNDDAVIEVAECVADTCPCGDKPCANILVKDNSGLPNFGVLRSGTDSLSLIGLGSTYPANYSDGNCVPLAVNTRGSFIAECEEMEAEGHVSYLILSTYVSGTDFEHTRLWGRDTYDSPDEVRLDNDDHVVRLDPNGGLRLYWATDGGEGGTTPDESWILPEADVFDLQGPRNVWPTKRPLRANGEHAYWIEWMDEGGGEGDDGGYKRGWVVPMGGSYVVVEDPEAYWGIVSMRGETAVASGWDSEPLLYGPDEISGLSSAFIDAPDLHSNHEVFGPETVLAMTEDGTDFSPFFWFRDGATWTQFTPAPSSSAFDPKQYVVIGDAIPGLVGGAVGGGVDFPIGPDTLRVGGRGEDHLPAVWHPSDGAEPELLSAGEATARIHALDVEAGYAFGNLEDSNGSVEAAVWKRQPDGTWAREELPGYCYGTSRIYAGSRDGKVAFGLCIEDYGYGSINWYPTAWYADEWGPHSYTQYPSFWGDFPTIRYDEATDSVTYGDLDSNGDEAAVIVALDGKPTGFQTWFAGNGGQPIVSRWGRFALGWTGDGNGDTFLTLHRATPASWDPDGLVLEWQSIEATAYANYYSSCESQLEQLVAGPAFTFAITCPYTVSGSGAWTAVSQWRQSEGSEYLVEMVDHYMGQMNYGFLASDGDPDLNGVIRLIAVDSADYPVIYEWDGILEPYGSDRAEHWPEPTRFYARHALTALWKPTQIRAALETGQILGSGTAGLVWYTRDPNGLEGPEYVGHTLPYPTSDAGWHVEALLNANTALLRNPSTNARAIAERVGTTWRYVDTSTTPFFGDIGANGVLHTSSDASPSGTFHAVVASSFEGTSSETLYTFYRVNGRYESSPLTAFSGFNSRPSLNMVGSECFLGNCVDVEDGCELMVACGEPVATPSQAYIDDLELTWIGTTHPSFELTATVGATCNDDLFNQVSISSVTPEITTTNNAASSSTPVAKTNLKVSVTADPAVAQPGTAVTYTVNVLNEGPFQTDASVTFEGPDSAIATAAGGNPGLTLMHGNIAPGETRSTVYTYALGAGLTEGILANASAVAAPAHLTPSYSPLKPIECDLGDNAATASSIVGSFPNVWVEKSGPPTALLGDLVEYLVTFGNNGNVAAGSVVLTDTLPVGFTYVDHTLSVTTPTTPTATVAAGSVTLSYGTDPVGVGEGGTLRIRGRFSECASVTQVLTNHVSITAPDDVNAADNQASAGTLVLPASANASLAVVTSHAYAVAGEHVWVTVHYANTGDDALVSPTLTATVPSGATLIPESLPAGASVDGATITLPTLGVIEPGQTGSATFVVVSTGEAFTVPATLAAGNLCAPATGTVGVLTPPEGLGIAGTKVADTAMACVDGTVTWTLLVSNRSDTPANNVVLTDTVPAGTPYVSSTGPGFDPSGLPNSLRWNLGTLAPGEHRVVSFTTLAPTSAGTLVTNAAQLAQGAVVGTTNTQAVAVDCSNPTAEVDKSANATCLVPGQEVTFRLDVFNRSTTSGWTGAFFDWVSPGWNAVAAPSGAIWNPATRQMTLDNLTIRRPSSGFYFEFTAQVANGLAPGTILFNRAALASGTAQPRDSNLVVAAVCDDGDPCTTNVCSESGCEFVPIPSCEAECEQDIDCDDGLGCTVDTCVEGTCVNTTKVCAEDGFSCTTRVCEEPTGDCVTTTNDALCGDAPDCVTLACDPTASGADPETGCAATLDDAQCDDGLPCTDDLCTQTGCSNPANDANACSDDDACTVDACVAGACVSTAISCDDGASCTTDSCDPASGCVHTPQSSACVNGPCISSVCDPDAPGADGSGCVSTVNAAACDDTNACTADSCDLATGLCANVPTPGLPCAGDDIACTTDFCDAAGFCVSTPSDELCGGLSGSDPCRAGFCDPASADANAEGCVVDNTPAGTIIETGVSCGGDLCGAGLGDLICDGEGNQVSTCDPAYDAVSGIEDDQCVEQEYVVYALIEDPQTGALRGSVRCVSVAGVITCETDGVDPVSNLPRLKIYDELLCPGTAPVVTNR